MVELSIFQLTSYTSLPSLPNPPTSQSMAIASAIHTTHTRPQTKPYQSPYHCIPQPSLSCHSRTNTIMTISCTLPHTRNYLFEPSAENLVDHPVHCAPVTINAANDNLPVHFINHSDRDVVVPKHTYVGAMEKVQESDQDNLSSNTTPEPVSRHAFYLNALLTAAHPMPVDA